MMFLIKTLDNKFFVWIDSNILNMDTEDVAKVVPDRALLVEKAIELSGIDTNFFSEDLMEIDSCVAHSQAIDPTINLGETSTSVEFDSLLSQLPTPKQPLSPSLENFFFGPDQSIASADVDK